MKENFLSQEEVDALLKKRESVEDEFIIGDTEKDIIGEVGNISMSTAATTLSSVIGRQVLITTPRVSWIPFQQIIDECEIPKIVAMIEFKHGITGINLLMVDVKDATIIADLMMGGDGSNVKEKLSELELSAVAEAMNQMIGSASTSMATMIGKEVDILPPDVHLWDKNENIDYKKITKTKNICKISFRLTVEGLIDSEIMQLYTAETVEDIVKVMVGGVNGEQKIEKSPEPDVESMEERVYEKDVDPHENPVEEKITVQKPAFPPLSEAKKEPVKEPRNLDLIMDVPLEFSVMLGKTRKTIKEILSFSNGSVVELNKLADEPLEIFVNGKLIAQGEVVVINENFGIRITNIMSKEQRVENLK
ncbi:MAG: flagellar motor switch phosphatase FliY [Eubacteriales bacterium]